MNIVDLHNQIISGKFKNFYFFVGEERTILTEYVKQIVKIGNYTPRYFDTFVEARQNMGFKKTFGKKILYVISDDDFLKNEEQQADLIKNNLKDIIFKPLKFDKRSKFFKEHDENFIEFNFLSPEQLIKYVKKDTELSDEQALDFVKLCGLDYGKILTELDKFKYFSTGRSPADYESFKNSGLLSAAAVEDVFNFCNLCARRDKRIFDIYAGLKDTNTVMLLKLLYLTFRQVLIASTDPGGPGVAARTGLNPYVFAQAQKHKGYFTPAEIINILGEIQRLEQGIKRGFIDEAQAIPFLLAGLL